MMPGMTVAVRLNPGKLKDFFERMQDAIMPTAASTPPPARPRAKQLGYRARLLYLAASSDNEYAYPTEHGSRATLAWSACLQQNPNQSGNDLLRWRTGTIERQRPVCQPGGSAANH